MDPIATHALTFLLGTATGAAGAYFAEKYTDIRRKKEARKELRANFRKLESLMSKLLAEMREDLAGDKSRLVRELVLLPSPNTNFNSDGKVRFAYYENRHQNLREQFQHLLGAGFVTDVTPGNTHIYRMTEQFVELLNER